MSVVEEHPVDPAKKIEDLGRIIIAYSEVTEKLEASHKKLESTVKQLSAELSEKNRQLERRKRLAALGEMAAGLAHEIRNPLGGIQLYASLLLKDVDDRPASADLVRKISQGVRRLEGLVSQVLTFSRDLRIKPAPSNIGDLARQAAELAGLSRSGAQVEVTGPEELEAEVDADLLGQTVLNLVRNGMESVEEAGMGEDGRVWVTYGKPADGMEARRFFLAVEDNGNGIEPGAMEKIFNPFFTTRDQGTGLGLAIAHRIVEAHDGTIMAMNREPRGARFEIRI